MSFFEGHSTSCYMQRIQLHGHTKIQRLKSLMFFWETVITTNIRRLPITLKKEEWILRDDVSHWNLVLESEGEL